MLPIEILYIMLSYYLKENRVKVVIHNEKNNIVIFRYFKCINDSIL